MGIWFMMLGFNLLIPAIMLGAGKLFLKKSTERYQLDLWLQNHHVHEKRGYLGICP